VEKEKYLKELSKCVRCGSCKAFCPTYDEDVTEAMGARGRLVLLWGLSEGLLKPSQVLMDRIFSCLACGACAESCPAGVDIQEVIYQGRRILSESDKQRKYARFLIKFFAKTPRLSFRILRTVRYLFPSLIERKVYPSLPEIPESPLKDKRQVYTVPKKKGRVALFTGCAVNFLYPHLGESLIHVLQRLNYEVILPAGEVCCGVPFRNLGLEEEAVKLARKNIAVFSKLNVEAIVGLCPTCIYALKKEYPKLIGEGLDKAMDISSFLIDKLDTLHFSPITARASKAVYHDPCHLNYGLGVKKEPREIIKKVGIDLIETEEQKCCGFEGVFSFSCQELSASLLEKRVRDISKTRAEIIITSCPGCMMQLGRGLKDVPAFHLIEVLEEVFEGVTNF
jgi:glycolate dehydrogenase iron-sulfur subunit